MKTGLCVIFNHPFREQIPLLRELYGERFETILFLHPFDPAAAADDVHVVYGGGFTFDAMIASARDRILRRFAGCDLVVFLHNDCLLNPSIHSDTFASEFGIEPGTILAPGFGFVAGALETWPWAFRAAANWLNPKSLFAGGGEHVKAFLPTKADALAAARKHGLNDATSLLPASDSALALLPAIYRQIHQDLFAAGPCDIEYPLQTGYSDFFAVAADILPDWLNNLGLLASMSLFAEVAVPTAHMLSARRIVTLAEIRRPFHMLWGDEERGTADNLEWVRQKFEDGGVLVHPIKYNMMPDTYIEGLRAMFRQTIHSPG